MKLGIYFKQTRKKMGITQIEMSQRLEICQGAISKIESDKMKPNGEAVVKLLRISRFNDLDVYDRLVPDPVRR